MAKKRLDSWKQIADYLGRDVRTAIRWEKDRQLPIHRVPGGKRNTVFAFTDEIDSWLNRGLASGQAAEPLPELPRPPGDSGGGNGQPSIQVAARDEGSPSGLARPRSRMGGGLATLAAAIVIASVVAAWLLWPTPLPSVTGWVQLTNDGMDKSPALVTDGPRLYFQEANDSRLVVVQVPVNGGRPMPVSPAWPDLEPVDISPDGSEILARGVAATTSDTPFWLLPLSGGPPRRLAMEGHCGAFSPDGARLAYFQGANLYVARKDGSESRRLIGVNGEQRELHWSPDGTTLRFALRGTRDSLTSLWEVSAAGSPNLRSASFTRAGPPLSNTFGNWNPDGAYFFFHSGSASAGDLWLRHERNRLPGWNNPPIRLTTGGIDFIAAAWSRDSKKIFALGRQSHGELVRYDAGSRQFVPYLGGIPAHDVSFSPDGGQVAYISGLDLSLWRSQPDGSQPLQLTFAPMQVSTPRWSPDGQSIVFAGNAVLSAGLPKIYLVPATGGPARELMPDDTDQANPTWSPDGKQLAFAGAPWLRGFRPESTLVRILTLATSQISTLPESRGFWAPKWSPDGRFILAETIDSAELMLFDLKGGKWRRLQRVNQVIGYPCWSHDGKYVYFNTYPPEAAVYRIRVSDGRMDTVLSLKGIRISGSVGPWFGLTPDDFPLLLRDIRIEEIYSLGISF